MVIFPAILIILPVFNNILFYHNWSICNSQEGGAEVENVKLHLS